MIFGLVNVSFSLPEWQAVKMTFFAPCCLWELVTQKKWSHMDVQLYKNFLLRAIRRKVFCCSENCYVLAIYRALLHTVIYFSFVGSCFTSISQWCYGSSLFFVCPDWLGSKVSNYFSTFKPQVWFPQTGLFRDVPLKHKTFIRTWKMLSNKQGLVKSLG